MLHFSVFKPAEEELEHRDLDTLASSEGIEQTLKNGLATRLEEEAGAPAWSGAWSGSSRPC